MSDSLLPTALYTCAEARNIDQIAIKKENIPGVVLMKRAAQFAFSTMQKLWPSTNNVLVMCGGGNNGGDGYIVAGLAAQRGWAVSVLSLVNPRELKGDAFSAYEFAVEQGLEVKLYSDTAFEQAASDSELIVDAMLGTGITRDVDGVYESAIAGINNSELPAFALDLPSGLCGDSGKIWGNAVIAQATATFIVVKRGLLTARAPAFVGELHYSDLAVPDSCFDTSQASCERISTSALGSLLPQREADAHKGKFGHVLLVGGDAGMGGAVVLAGEAAARSGAGLSSIATRPEHVGGVLARCPELMVHGVASGQALEPILEKPDVIVLGPGMGRASWSEQMLQQATLTGLPLVMDADALNLLAEGRVVRDQKRDNWVLTPHPGEAARLLACSTEEIQADRFAAAIAIQQKFGGVVVLKGAGTLIASEERCLLANVGNPGMAVGGMGDILSGVIGALIAQGLPLLEAAALAVCVHGDAADCCVDEVGERGVLASDLIPYIRHFLN